MSRITSALVGPHDYVAAPGTWRGAATGGVIAGLAAVTTGLAVRVLAGVPTLGELLQDRLIQATPGPVFAFILDHLHYLGKPLFFLMALLAQVVLGGALGIIVWRWRRPYLVAGAAWAIAVLALLWLAGEQPAVRTGSAEAALLLAALVYASTFELMWAGTRRTDRTGTASTPARTVTRRQLLALGALLATSGALARRVIGRLPSLASSGGSLPPAITPTDDFYIVSKNLTDPVLQASGWRLEISGLVDRPVQLTYEQIRALPSEEFVRTLECISNEIGGSLMSTGRFVGVRMRDVLAAAGVQTEARLLHFTSVDGYTENMPLQLALNPSTFLVYLLDGQPLSAKHGFPVRVLAAGNYGMKNPKWLTRIEVAQTAPDGFWEAQGWSNDAVIQTMSRIDLPGVKPVAPPVVEIAGIAFAGDRGIQRVEISVDGGTWTATDLEGQIAPSTWQFWRAEAVVARGLHNVAVRATDGLGHLQSAEVTGTFPDGATGTHDRTIEVQPPADHK